VQYMLLIYGTENGAPQGGDREAMYRRFAAFSQELRDSGKMVGGDELQPTTTATTVRVRDGEALTTDGPFAETKEQLGGYYIVDCDDLDEAIAWAAKIPSAEHGSIEVRPIVQR